MALDQFLAVRRWLNRAFRLAGSRPGSGVFLPLASGPCDILECRAQNRPVEEIPNAANPLPDPCRALLGCLFAGGDSEGERAALESLLSSVTQTDLKKHVEFLADDTLEGREAGSRGGQAAGHYLGEQFQKYRLAGGGARGLPQSFGNNYRNILGVLEGSDPALKHEIVLVGAHYDHVGYGNSSNSYGPTGFIHNGARRQRQRRRRCWRWSRPSRARVRRRGRSSLRCGTAKRRRPAQVEALGRKPHDPFGTRQAGHQHGHARADEGRQADGLRPGPALPGYAQMVSRRNAADLLVDFDWSPEADSVTIRSTSTAFPI